MTFADDGTELRTRIRSVPRAFVPLALLVGFAGAASGATLSVTNTNDSGAGSLRQAILEHQMALSADTIVFNIPGAGVKTIAPATDLPALDGELTIDGFSQPGSVPNTSATGSNAALLIELAGPGGGGDGLRSAAATLTVQGLIIGGWNGSPASAGVHFSSASARGRAKGCHIGTDAAGMLARPNSIGILVEAFGVRIGADIFEPASTNADRNLISGNSGDGVRIHAAGAVVAGNLIGMNATGIGGFGNGGDGIKVLDAAATVIGCGNGAPQVPGIACGNVVGKNGGAGIRFSGANADLAYVFPGWIGTDTTGTIPLGNAGPGVLIEQGAGRVNLGSRGFSEVTTIAFNGGAGVAITGNGIANFFSGALIFGNTGLNIDLGNDGPTLNDPCDADTGPNTLENKPVLTQISSVAGTFHVLGTYETALGLGLASTIEYFTSPSCDPSNPAAIRPTGDASQIDNQGACTVPFDHALDSLTAHLQAGDAFLVGIATNFFLNGSSEVSNCLAIPALVSPGVNLRLDMTASPDPATQGLPLVYTLTVTNNGQTTARGVRVTDPLPPGSTYLTGDTGCKLSGNRVTCNYGTLAGNGSFSTRHVSVVPSLPGLIANSANATSSASDDNTADNADIVITPVATAVYDLAASSTGGGFTCLPSTSPTKKVCRLAQTITLLNHGNPWLTGDLTLTSACKRIATPAVSCKLTGKFRVGTFSGFGVPAHQVTVYLSSDAAVDPADTSIATATSVSLGALAPGHRSARITYSHPQGQSDSGQYILLGLDSLDAVDETDEGNNVLLIGTLP